MKKIMIKNSYQLDGVNHLNLFYIEITANTQIKNKRESFVLVFESASKFSASSNAIAYLYQLGFSNIEIEQCHRASPQEIASYFYCCNTSTLN